MGEVTESEVDELSGVRRLKDDVLSLKGERQGRGIEFELWSLETGGKVSSLESEERRGRGVC